MKRIIVLWLILAPVAGCGTSAYSNSKNLRLTELQKAAAFVPLFPGGTELPGTNVSVRLPLQFTAVFVEGTPDPKKPDQTFDLRRLYPPFLAPFPGFKFCYETMEKDAGGTGYPYYCYLGAKSLAPTEKAIFETELIDKLKQVFPDAQWIVVDVPTPSGDSIRWKKVVVKGEQPFALETFAGTEFKNVPGTFELWLHEGKVGDVLIGWRIPDVVAAKIKLDELAAATAGTLVIKPDAKP